MPIELAPELGLDEPLLISPVYFHVSHDNSTKVHTCVSDLALDVIARMPCACSRSEYHIMVLPGRIKGMDNPESLKTLPYMREFARRYSLEALPEEATFFLWKHLDARVLRKIGLRSIIAMHESISDGMGIRWLFKMGMYEGEYRLGAVPDFGGEVYPPNEYGFAFLVPRFLVSICRKEYSFMY